MTGVLKVNDETYLDLSDTVPVPLNFSIADIKDPQKRKRSYSATIDLPGTQNNMNFFASAYSLSLTTEEGTYGTGFTFDASKATPVKYYKSSGILSFSGVLQLNDVTINPGGQIQISVTINSEYSNIMLYLADTLISEMGWSKYDHILNRSNIKKTWDTSVYVNGVDTPNFSAGQPLGFGYLYPLIDFGFPRVAPTTFKTYDLIPHIYERELILKCFELAGLTVQSNWLNSTLIRKRIFGYGGGDRNAISAAQANQRKVEVDGNYSRSITKSYTSAGQNIGGSYNVTFNFPLGFSLFSEPEFTVSGAPVDTLGQYDETTGIITIARAGTYKIDVSGLLNLSVDDGGMDLQTQSGFGQIYIRRNGAVVASSLKAFIPYDDPIDVSTSVTLALNVGDTVEAYLVSQLIQRYSVDSLNDAVPVELNYDGEGLALNISAVNTTLIDGQIVELSRFLPDLKASEYLAGVIKAWNLYVSDPDVNGVVRIEPLEDYYEPTDVFDDYSQIIDHKKPISIKTASEIEGKNYIFEFADDNDYDNKVYKDRFGIGYGNKRFIVENTFVKGDRTYKLPFAQSVPVDIVGTTLIVPRIVNFDENTGAVKPYKGKPRTYFYNGLKSGNWKLSDTGGAGSEILSSYPCVNHFDDISNPEFDFSWQLPEVLFFTTTEVTTSNLFSVYHETFVREATGRDAKIVTCFVKYNADDANNLRFQRVKNWNGVRFRLNTVSDFDTDFADSIQVELVKVLKAKNPRRFKYSGGLTPIKGLTAPVISGGSSNSPDLPVILGGVKGGKSSISCIIKG